MKYKIIQDHYESLIRQELANKKLMQKLIFDEQELKEQLALYALVESERDITLALLEEIMIKIKIASSAVENGTNNPMLDCTKHILDTYVITKI